MREKSGSGGLRWLTALILAVAAIPMVMAWHSAQAPVETAAAPDTDNSEWINPSEIAVQLREGVDDSTLADLSKKVGFTLEWNSAVSKTETEVAELTLPAGTDPQPVLEALKSDPR